MATQSWRLFRSICYNVLLIIQLNSKETSCTNYNISLYFFNVLLSFCIALSTPASLCVFFLIIPLSCYGCFVFSAGNCSSLALTVDYADHNEYRLARRLIEDYKARSEVRPVDKQEDAVIVTFDLAYSQLVDLVSTRYSRQEFKILKNKQNALHKKRERKHVFYIFSQ